MNTHLRQLNDLILRDLLRLLINLVRHILRRRPPIRHIVLDPKVIVRAARVVARGEQDPAVRLVLADHVRRGGRGQDARLPDDELRDAVRGADLEDRLHGLGGEEATITTDDEGLPLGLDGVEDGLDEVLRVVLYVCAC